MSECTASRQVVLALVFLLFVTPMVAPAVAAQETTPTSAATSSDGNQTATPTPAGNQTQANASGAEAGESNVTSLGQRAQLSIEQLPYVDSAVEQTERNGTVIYIAEGEQVEIVPRNFDQEDVVDWGVSNRGAQLTYDDVTGEYTLQTEQAGLYTVWWRVSTPEGEDAPASRSRYIAGVQLRKVDRVHITRSEYNALQNDSANWSEVVNAYAGIGPDIPIEEKIQKSLNAWQFLSNPIAALQGDFVAALITLTFTNGGRLLLALLLAIPAAIVAPIVIKYRRLKKDMPDLASLDREKLRQWRRKKKSQLVEKTPHDVEALDSRTAAKVSETIGENLWTVSNRLHQLLPDETLKRIYVRAMLVGDWHGRRRVRASDGGATGGGSAVELALAQDETELPTGDEWEAVEVEDVDAETAAAAEWDEIDLTALDEQTPIDALDVPLQTDQDLLSTFDVQIPEDFDDREHFAEAMWHCCRAILSSKHTDDEGVIRPERSFLNLVTALTATTAERYDVPTMRRYRDLFMYISSSVDTDDDLVRASQETGYGDLGLDLGRDRDA